MRGRLLNVGLRLLLLIGGIALIASLVHQAGPEQVLAAMQGAVAWLPLLVLLEAGFVAWDALIVRHLAGEAGRATPWWAHLRAAMVAYPFMALMPAGRAGAEAARATALSPWFGASRAAAVAAQTQGFLLAGNGLISIPILLTMLAVLGLPAAGGGDIQFVDGLLIAVALNAIIGIGIGFGLVATLRGVKLGGRFGRLFRRFAEGGESFDRHTRASKGWLLPATYATAGRAVQTLQYGLFVVAVGGTFTGVAALVAHGIHLAGALVGDLVPAQAGVVEGAFSQATPAVYDTFGFATPEAALGALVTVELLRKTTTIFWSIVGVGVPILWRLPVVAGETIAAGQPEDAQPDAGSSASTDRLVAENQ